MHIDLVSCAIATQTDNVMTLEDLHYYENHYYTFNRRMLRFVGLWPYQKPSKRAIHINFINCTMIMFCVQICAWIISDVDMSQTFELLPIFLPFICFTFCYNSLLRSFKTVTKVFERIRLDWTEMIDQRNILILQRHAHQTKFYAVTIGVLFYTCNIVILPSVIRVFLNLAGIIKDTQLTLPFPVGDAIRNKPYYYFMLWFQAFSIFIGSTVGIVHFTMYISFIQHTYALCSIVAIKLDEPFERNLSKSDYVEFNEGDYYWVVDVIKCYNKVLSFVKLINAIYSKTFLIESSSALLYVIADYIYFFKLMNDSENIGKILLSATYTIASLIIIYAMCFLGQKLIDHNKNISMKCCQIPFYELSVKTQKILLLLIMRSMRPCCVSMRGLIVVSYELFAKIMQTSFSFATAFYSIR